MDTYGSSSETSPGTIKLSAGWGGTLFGQTLKASPIEIPRSVFQPQAFSSSAEASSSLSSSGSSVSSFGSASPKSFPVITRGNIARDQLLEDIKRRDPLIQQMLAQGSLTDEHIMALVDAYLPLMQKLAAGLRQTGSIPLDSLRHFSYLAMAIDLNDELSNYVVSGLLSAVFGGVNPQNVINQLEAPIPPTPPAWVSDIVNDTNKLKQVDRGLIGLINPNARSTEDKSSVFTGVTPSAQSEVQQSHPTISPSMFGGSWGQQQRSPVISPPMGSSMFGAGISPRGLSPRSPPYGSF